MLRQSYAHLLGALFPQPRRSLDVPEQKSHSAKRRAIHRASLPLRPVSIARDLRRQQTVQT